MGYVGNEPLELYVSKKKQSLTGNGTTGPYTLTDAVSSEQDLEVFVNNVRQEPGTAYTVSGTALTMTGNVAVTDDFYVVYDGFAQGTNKPEDGSVGTAQLANGSVGTAQLANGSVTQAKIANNLSFPTSVIAPTQTSSVSGSVTIDLNAYQNFVLTMTGGVTLANPSTGRAGQTGFIVFKQDGTGSHVLSLGSNFKTAGAGDITLSTAPNSVDFVPYSYLSSTEILLGTPQLAFA